jgi:hypothetical protein
LDFSLAESGLENLNLFIQEGKLVVTSNKLGSENITLIDNVLVVFLELLMLFVGLFNNVS